VQFIQPETLEENTNYILDDVQVVINNNFTILCLNRQESILY